MALVTCKYCGKTVSDKAGVCPSCGYKIDKERKCPECGYAITDEVTACPQCGCPITDGGNVSPQKVEVTGVNIGTLNKKTIITLIVAVVVIIIGVISGITISNNVKAERTKAELDMQIRNYESNLKKASTTMLVGAAEAETAANLIHDVWYNTIYEISSSKTDKYTKVNYGSFNSDFNTSLALLFLDESFNADIESIKDNQEQVKKIMKNLTNPPEGYQEAYNAIKAYYDAYLELTNLAVDPSGNLTSYTSSLNEADSNVSKCYEAMDIYLK